MCDLYFSTKKSRSERRFDLLDMIGLIISDSKVNTPLSMFTDATYSVFTIYLHLFSGWAEVIS